MNIKLTKIKPIRHNLVTAQGEKPLALVERVADMPNLYRTTKTAYYLKNEATGDKYKVARNLPTEIYINGGDDGILTVGYEGTVYDSKKREWSEKMGSYFYPFATAEKVELAQKLFDAISAKKKG